MIIFALYILLSFLVGACAKRTGRDMSQWVVISVITSPGIGGLLLLIGYVANGKIKPAPPGKPSNRDYAGEIKKMMSDRYDF